MGPLPFHILVISLFYILQQLFGKMLIIYSTCDTDVTGLLTLAV